MDRTSLNCATRTCGQEVQQCQTLGLLFQGSKGKFRNDEWMNHNVPLVKKSAHLFVA